jgi:hypothetical protein
MRQPDEWKRLFRDFDPWRALEPTEIETHYATHGDPPSDRIQAALEDAAAPASQRFLLAGARGSGKTTELLRLFAAFNRPGPLAAVIPIYVDVADVLPEHTTTRTWLPLLAATIRAVRKTWTSDPGPDLAFAKSKTQLIAPAIRAAGQLARFVPGAEPAAAPLESLSAAIQALTHLGRDANESMAEEHHLRKLLTTITADLLAIAHHAERPPLLLLDGFDKRGSLESVLEALNEADLLVGLPAALVVSGPMELSLHPQFAANLVPGRFRAIVQHTIPVVNPDGTPDPTGVDVLRDLFDRRWTATGLTGAPPLHPKAIAAAAKWSSGIVREFLEIVRQTAHLARRRGRDEANDDDLAAAVRERRMDYERTITTDLWDQLEEVLRTRERPRANLDELLYTNRLACYPNGGAWFRPHELLIPHLEERARRRQAP